ncbi:hypothetical protein I316_00119 [Kwoniella heveanensis BCC8398]|uniref:Uncharacterized protein n=1 Tax=Kwoniella heveanensis BCC8398 TaxID=1296120 RepID=A0A1B9H3Q3_9TREE|nr:hypothetical protein I316_00119 [Kwoniella heveanensis BCC8398]
MSVKPTHTQISEHPGKMGVTSAASGAELEADIQRKLKLWGVVAAFRDGRMPDNRQIDSALEYAISHSPVELNKLSPEGRVLVDDFRDIIETARMIVAEKNADELFQEAVWASYAGDASRAKQSGVVPVSKADAQADGKQAAAHLRVLISLFVTNSEARKLLNDFGIIGRDIFATGAAKVADKARPNQEQLDSVDQEAPSNQWIGADGKRLGPNDTPEVQVKGPSGAQVTYNPKDDPRDARVVDTEGNERSSGQVYDKAQEAHSQYQNKKEDLKSSAVDTARGHGQEGQQKEELKGEAKAHAKDIASSRDPNASYSTQKDQMLGRANEKTPNDVDVQNGNVNRNTDADRAQAEDTARAKGNQLLNKIPDEHRERAANAIQDTKQFFQEQLPEERRDQFIYRLKKVVVECQNHKDYQEAMSWLLDTLENYQGHAKHIASKGADSAQAVASDPSIGDSTLKFRTLLERFANGRSLNGVTDALDQIYTDAQNDSHLRGYFSRLNDYAHRVLLEPGFILDEDSDREANQLREDGKAFFTDRYKGHQERLFDELQVFFTAFNDDPLNRRFGDDLKRLFKDLLFNSEGDFQFKPKLWNDVRNILLPTFIRQVGYIPIPRAEYSDDKIDLVIENLVLSGPNLAPNELFFQMENSLRFSPYPQINKQYNDQHHHRFRVSMNQIQADIRDVAFAFRRKSGWPKISDHGLADVVIAGKGIGVDVECETVENRRDSVFKVNHVNVTIDTLKFSIRDSKHDLLYKFIKATATGVIKKAVTVAVQTAIRGALEHADDQLVEVRNRMDDAKRSEDTNRTETLKQLYSRKKETAKDNARKADEHTGTFKIVTDRESQLNPDLTHSSEKSSAQRLFKTTDLANSGKEWHSTAFDLFDKQHPAVTGQHHPSAVKGAGNQNTHAVDQARRQA